MASFSASVLLMFAIAYTVLARAKEGVTLTAPLLHWSSPESPFYRPNATPAELIQASVRASRARSKHINMLLGNYSGKWPVSPISLVDAVYVMKISVGTPPFETYAVPDTASHLIWLQCGSPCTNCYKQRLPYFDPTKSTTYKALPCKDRSCVAALLGQNDRCLYARKKCGYHLRYADGAYTEGFVSEDVFTFAEDIEGFGNFTIKDGIFGCGFNNSNPLGGYGPPGVVGLNSQASLLVKQLTPEHARLFSYCISRDRGHANAKIQIKFGVTATVPDGDSTALAPNNKGLYIFRDVEGLYSDEVKIKGPDWVFQYADGGLGGVLMDTGTTYSEFYYDIVDNLVLTLKDQIEAVGQIDFSDYNFSLCYLTEDWFRVGLPDIELRFKNSTEPYPLRIDNVWIDNGKGQYCLAIYKTRGMSIIGLTVQRGIVMGYNLDANTVSYMPTENCVPFA